MSKMELLSVTMKVFAFYVNSQPLSSPEPISKPHSPLKPSSCEEVRPESPHVLHAEPDDDLINSTEKCPDSGEKSIHTQHKTQTEPSLNPQSSPTVKRRKVMGPLLAPSAPKHKSTNSHQKVGFN